MYEDIPQYGAHYPNGEDMHCIKIGAKVILVFTIIVCLKYAHFDYKITAPTFLLLPAFIYHVLNPSFATLLKSCGLKEFL